MSPRPLKPQDLLEPPDRTIESPIADAAEEGGIPDCPNCKTPMDEVTQLNKQGSLGWGYAGHAANRLYLMGLLREQGMTMRTIRLRAFCCPKCRRGEFRY